MQRASDNQNGRFSLDHARTAVSASWQVMQSFKIRSLAVVADAARTAR
jgi:hypothetical protein